MANEETLLCEDAKGQSRGKTSMKDIYIIRNTVNDKCYIGQSVDYKLRFRKHREEAKRGNYKYRSVLYDAMNEIGIEHFYVEILEENVTDPDEREVYWIERLNTLYPNGYNLADGGVRYPNLRGLMHHNSKVASEDVLNYIYDSLINTDASIDAIAEAAGVSPNIVRDINRGDTYFSGEYKYPLREISMTKDMVDRLTFDLKYSNLSYEELASIYGISFEHVKAINYGLSWKRDYIDYPIRRMCFGRLRDADAAEKIQRDLISTTMSFDEIAEKYNCSSGTVRRICMGGSHRNDSLKYPLRKIKRPLSQEKINEVCELLASTDKSVKQISDLTGIPPSTVRYINSGTAKKYINPNYKYPIRNKK